MTRPEIHDRPIVSISKLIIALVTASLLFHCSTANHTTPESTDLWPAATNQQTLFYLKEVQPLLNKRCVVCHTCNVAPCQLHLDSYEGLRRGATYGDMGSSLLFSEPTRDKDAKTIAEWRHRHFFPILPDLSNKTSSTPSSSPPEGSVQTNPVKAEDTLLYRFLELGQSQNRPGFSLDPINEHREQSRTCPPHTTAFENYAKKFPFAGMPYGLPGLESSELSVIKKWIEQGAPAPNQEYLDFMNSSSIPEQITEWENTFNSSPKARLMARYIYEHMYSAHIHFKGTPATEWYEIVRSSTGAPSPIREIVTRRPYDDPKTRSVFYRFKRFTRTIARPSHIPWEIGTEELQHYKQSFLETPWTSPEGETSLTPLLTVKDPGYLSTNPFRYFKQIPAKIRYQFLLENSQVIANAMIRGPACIGRIATNAIRDHFWVFFIKPESDVTVTYPQIGQSEWTPLSELDLKAFIEPSIKYTNAMNKLKPLGFDLEDLWNGDRKNPNALLTVLRHGTGASVHQGLLGGKPPTFWVLNFSNFERIYYNLVVDYEHWGSSAHKASTWNYMSRHRAEAEERFISLLPEKYRKDVRFQWTQGLGSAMNLSQAELSLGIKSKVKITDEKSPVNSLLLQMLPQYKDTQINPHSQWPQEISTSEAKEKSRPIETLEDWEKAFWDVTRKTDLPVVRYVPDIVFIKINDQTYTMVNHRFYKFNNMLALEKLAYEPSKNKIYLLKGLVGDRPEYFADLQLHQLEPFLRDFERVSLYKDWVRFKAKYFVRRNDPKVWDLSDWFNEWLAKNDSLNRGILDLREYDVQTDE